jgi:hypothetical protein
MARAVPAVPDLTCFAHLTLIGFYDFQYRMHIHPGALGGCHGNSV